MAYLVRCPACDHRRRIDPGVATSSVVADISPPDHYCTRIDCERSWSKPWEFMILPPISVNPRHSMTWVHEAFIRALAGAYA